MYRACMWSGSENLDGIAIIQTKDIYGNWTTLRDIPINYLKSKVMKKSVWKQILQIFITVATSIISALGVTSGVAHI